MTAYLDGNYTPRVPINLKSTEFANRIECSEPVREGCSEQQMTWPGAPLCTPPRWDGSTVAQFAASIPELPAAAHYRTEVSTEL